MNLQVLCQHLLLRGLGMQDGCSVAAKGPECPQSALSAEQASDCFARDRKKYTNQAILVSMLKHSVTVRAQAFLGQHADDILLKRQMMTLKN